MADKSERDLGSPDTLNPADFPIGSPESRAAARRFLQSGATKILKWYFVKGLESDENDNIIRGPVRECECDRVTLSGFEAPTVEFVRAENETAEEFENRVYAAVPVAGPPGSYEPFIWSLTFHPRKNTDGQAE